MWTRVWLHKLRKELQLKHGRRRCAPVTKNDTPDDDDDDDEDSDGEMVSCSRWLVWRSGSSSGEPRIKMSVNRLEKE